MTNHDFWMSISDIINEGFTSVIASLLAGAEVGTDQLSAPKGSFKREQQLGNIQKKRISHD